MSKPNNCEMCQHKKNPDGGHCYMFRLAPTEPCMQHTVRTLAASASRQRVFALLAKKAQP